MRNKFMPEPGMYPGMGDEEYRPDPYAPEYEMPRRYVPMGSMDCEFENYDGGDDNDDV